MYPSQPPWTPGLLLTLAPTSMWYNTQLQGTVPVTGMAAEERIIFQRQSFVPNLKPTSPPSGCHGRTEAVFSQSSNRKPPLTRQPSFASVKKAVRGWWEHQLSGYYTLSTGKRLPSSNTQSRHEDLQGLQLVSRGAVRCNCLVLGIQFTRGPCVSP